MCGRFAMDKHTDELIQEFVAAGGRAQDWAGSYSIAPTQSAPIVRERLEDDVVDRQIELARWDWDRPASRPTVPIINARMEKLPERFWVGAFSRARCIVPMLGYYEWTGEKGSKTPHWIHSDELLAAAGLTWTADVAGERRRVFVVVTREARDASGEIHDRMPAFLTRDLWDAWLDPQPLTVDGDTATSKRNRLQLLDELEASSSAVATTIRTHVVDRKVNNARTADPSDPTLIQAV
ncbi:SOS response-associated peptidase [Microbacterium sp. B2969]|uniref:Abasic site processing protein n=1 Tax=Microbacterium alkaliflavum TaxID=3248839 RepID=A0ABW7QI88_9MICO